MAKLFFYDTETTGLYSSKHAIHQIAGAIVIDGVVKETFNFHLAPHADAVIDEQALAVSNVTKEQIMAYPSAKSVHIQLMKMLGKYVDKFNKQDKFFLVGFNNASFDDDFFRSLFNRCDDRYFGSWFWADPLDIRVLAAQHLRDVRHTMPDFKLKTVAKQLGIEVDDTKLHDADYDIEITRAVYDILTGSKKNDQSVAEVESVVEAVREVLLERQEEPPQSTEEKLQEIVRFTNEVSAANEVAKAEQNEQPETVSDQELAAAGLLINQ